ncbi:FAD-binding protein [Nocardia flavorosea]|uniref:3-oxosteroid 1-dehydrogenase n=1 Tax=Nocardia flavorosea TaxID=53429 RepID=A0A846YLG1_9NOCA|nr:FAD-binding protein [Nocardia flavorosea]NKY60486.1 FAD-binding protein [Nocardia flavorosea]
MSSGNDSDDWDIVTDLLVVGSGGGGLCAALTAQANGIQALVVEKTPQIGGSTAMSGGVLWLPDNPVSRAAGVPDSREDARRYFDAVVGDEGPATSKVRREAFLDAVEPMVEFLRGAGVPFRHCEGYSDYYDDRPGGKARGRSLETDLFDTATLGPWESRLRITDDMPPIPAYTADVSALSVAPRTAKSLRTVAAIAGRFAAATLRGRRLRGSGVALQGYLLRALIDADIPVWTNSPMSDLTTENGQVTGAVVERNGRRLRVRARRGVLLAAGGFARNEAMRQKYGRQPASAAWTSANPGDSGEVIETAIQHGAAVDLMDEAWWIPSSILPNGRPVFAVYERSKPYAFMVDGNGERYCNEAASYMEVGRKMYERHADGFTAVPSWWITDSRNRARYLWGTTPGGITPREWLTSGYVKRADSIEELARLCGIDPARLRATTDRFNAGAVRGEDPDFHKGERTYDRYYGDPAVHPNPCLGPVEKGPFYAFTLYPGDVGTSGGVLTDEHARVLRDDGEPVAGLYATGNGTASLVGRHYPGAGASIGVSFAFGWIAARHAAGSSAGGTSTQSHLPIGADTGE